jgi:mutual gliding-motility protein MglA
VLETLHAVLQGAYRSMDAQANLGRNLGLAEAEFLGQVFASIDVSGTELQERYGKSSAEGTTPPEVRRE